MPDPMAETENTGASTDSNWQDIDSYKQDLWNGEVVELRDDDGNQAVGSWGYEDESWNSATGEEYIWGAWHKGEDDFEPLGFDPTQWRTLDKAALWPSFAEGDVLPNGTIVSTSGLAIPVGEIWIKAANLPQAQGHGWQETGKTADGLVSVRRDRYA